MQVTPKLSSHSVPVSQVIDGIEVPWEDPIIWRWDRRRAITVQCSPNDVTAPTLRNAVVEKFEAIELPPGYRLDWDGEYWSAKQSQEALAPGIVPAVVIMLFLLVVALAVTIFFGLIVGTVLTMVMVPTLYALLYRIPAESSKEPPAEPDQSPETANQPDGPEEPPTG